MKALLIVAFVAVVFYAVFLSPLLRRIFSPLSRNLPEDNSRTIFRLGLVFTFLVTGLYAFLVFNRSFPLPEGWYTMFSHYILKGMQPYKDFEFLYTPGYVYIITALVKVFGSDIIVLRIFGALLFSGLAAVLYATLTKFFKPWVSVAAACSAVFYMQSEVAQVFYDYIRVYDFFNFLVGLFLILYLRAMLSDSVLEKRKQRRAYAFLTGIAAGLAVLIRQNSGYIVWVYCFILLLFLMLCFGSKKAKWLELLWIFLGGIIPLLVINGILALNGMLSAYLSMTTSDAIASKGGLTAVLFGWIPRTIPAIAKESKMILLVMALLLANAALFWLYRKRPKLLGKYTRLVCLLSFSGIAVVAILLMYKSKRIATLFEVYFYPGLNPYSIFALLFLLFLGLGFWLIGSCLIKRKSRAVPVNIVLLFAFSGLYIATAYGSATSAGFSEGQSAIAVAILVALLLTTSIHKFYREALSIAMALVILFAMSGVGKKFNLPYSWWGLAEPEIRQAVYPVETPLLKGIYVSKERKAVLEGVYKDIIRNSEPEDPIFVFPHMPIFYVMSDRFPETFTLVQWFDVSSEAMIKKDTKLLQENPPKVMVLCRLPENVIAGHEKLFRGDKESAQRQMMNALFTMAENEENGYVLVSTYDLGASYELFVYARAD